MKRINERARDEKCLGCSPPWLALKQEVSQSAGIEPFQQITDIRHPAFRYLNSTHNSQRFEILEGDEPYTATSEWVNNAARTLPPGAGPVEVELATFMTSPLPELGILVGGMGSGKSTTLRQLAEWVKGRVAVHHINCNNISIDDRSPPSADELLFDVLSPLTFRLLGPDEEIIRCWDWAFDRYCNQDAGDRYSATVVFGPAVAELRVRYGEAWARNDVEGLALRRQELTKILSGSFSNKLKYLAVKLDYYLSTVCENRRSDVCVVLDNIDPFPPLLQRELLLMASGVQQNAQCKVLLAMRPLTYSLTHGQAATRVVKVMQHIGPAPLDLIKDRLGRLVVAANLEDLKFPVRPEVRAERTLTQADFKGWVQQVISDLEHSRPPGSTRSCAPSARTFVDGLCNNSLRTTLMVAEKIFGSHKLSMIIPDEAADHAHSTRLQSHDIIRAVLRSQQSCFIGLDSRVTDNLFDLGDTYAATSPTCKLRLLKELAEAPGRGILELDDLVARLRPFGYPDGVILRSVNAIISQVKRMAWSDKVDRYDSLVEPAGTRLSISRAGRFYVKEAIFSLEYVQEVHVDVLMPNQDVVRDYRHDDVVERFDSLYRFVRYLHDVDRKEVQSVLAENASRRYVETYGASLISLAIVDAVADQVRAVGRANLHNWQTRRRGANGRAYALEKTLSRWASLGAVLRHEDMAIIAALEKS